MKKTIWLAVAVIIIIIVIVSVSSNKKAPATSAASSEPVKIGAALMLTGPAALVGEMQKNAVTLAVDDINAAGGINGRHVDLVIQDATYDPKNAISAYESLKQQGIHLFIMDGSPILSAIRKPIVDDGNFNIAAVAYAPSYFDGSDHTCRIALTAKSIGPSLSDLAVSRGYKKVAILVANNEQGKGLADEFTKAFNAKGGTVVVSEFYSADNAAGDYRTSMTKIKTAQPGIDAIVFSNVLNTIGPMLKQMKDFGVTKPLISEVGTLDNPALKGDFTSLEGVEYVAYDYTKTDRPSDSDAAKKFKAEYRAKYNTDPVYIPAGHYDITMILAKAIGAVGEDPSKVADYVSSLKDYNGVTGTYSFNSDCEVSRPSMFYKIQAGKIIQTK